MLERGDPLRGKQDILYAEVYIVINMHTLLRVTVTSGGDGSVKVGCSLIFIKIHYLAIPCMASRLVHARMFKEIP